MSSDAVKILVVDDTEANLTAIAAVLEPLDVTLVLVRSGAEALRQLLGGAFALILLDVRMPDMDGFEIARLIRARARTRDTPLIFVSAVEPSEALLNEGYTLGAVDFVSKPLSPVALRSKVAVFAALHRRARGATGPTP